MLQVSAAVEKFPIVLLCCHKNPALKGKMLDIIGANENSSNKRKIRSIAGTEVNIYLTPKIHCKIHSPHYSWMISDKIATKIDTICI